MRDVFERLLADFHARALPAATRRRVRLPHLPGKADAVIGMRRSGKTWLLYQVVGEQERAGVPREHIAYVDFEDDRLVGLTAADLPALTETWFRRVPSAADSEHWLLLDEIQNVPGWERFVRRMVETPGARVVLSGSSARLLSAEIATSLRGRSLPTELLPFSFAEFLDHHNVEVPIVLPPAEASRARLAHALDRYLQTGGLPEVQGLEPRLRTRVLQDYVAVVVLRDVAERHAVSNLPVLRTFARQALARPATRFSVSRFYRELRGAGRSVDRDALYAWLDHLEDAFLVFRVPLASPSDRRRRVNPPKVYAIDPALARSQSFAAGRDIGHLLENVVYLELRRRGFSTGYLLGDGDVEVDFLAQRADTADRLVQVCADPSDPSTRAREERALAWALADHPDARAVVVSLQAAGVLEVSGRRVPMVPAWQWLLEDDD